MPFIHVLASLPNTCTEILHDHQFVRRLHCFKESVQVLCIFFFVTLVYVHCHGDMDDVGRRHSMYQGKTSDFRLSEGLQTPQREHISRAPVPSARCCLSRCSAGDLGPGPVVPRVFSAVPSFSLWMPRSGACRSCHTRVTR